MSIFKFSYLNQIIKIFLLNIVCLFKAGNRIQNKKRISLLLTVFLFWGWGFSLFDVNPAQAQDLRGQTSHIIAKGFNITAQKNTTFFTILLSKEVQATFYAMNTPNRLVIDLPEVEFHIATPKSNQKGGMISSFRFGLFAQGRSRVVIDLTEPVTVRALQGKVQDQEDMFFYTLELKRSSRENFANLVIKTDPTALMKTTPQIIEPQKSNEKFVVVIDPGHGGIDPGATTNSGIQEKDIVFAFAQTVAEQLKTQKKFHVILTRSTDVFVPLGERVRIAQREKANLFISIHADSISAAPQVSGFTIYSLSQKASDRESAKLADRENQADSVAGIVSPEIQGQVVDILQELTIRETRVFSKQLAEHIISKIETVMRLNKNPYRQAGFHVLKAYDIPSVLIELGYLSSKKDIDLLMSEEWRIKAAQAITQAINIYFDHQKRIP